MCCSVLQCVAVWGSGPQEVRHCSCCSMHGADLCCSVFVAEPCCIVCAAMVLHCVWCRAVLQSVCCRLVLQCVCCKVPPVRAVSPVVSCSELQCVAECWYYSLLQCVVVCCSVLQCVAVTCSVLQCVAVTGMRGVTTTTLLCGSLCM